jgi:preprotein translocase subunit YajC
MHLPSLSVLAQQPPSPSGMDFVMQLAPLVLIFAVFYFLLIAPARKRQKELQKMLEALKRGDKVVTASGMFGEVVAVEGPNVILKIADNVKVKFSKGAISAVEQPSEKEGNS